MNRDIDQVKNQKPQLNKRESSVKFNPSSENGDQQNDTSTAEDTANEEVKQDSSRSAKWFDQCAEFDVTIQASFIAFSI
jgi:hypothetical protein